MCLSVPLSVIFVKSSLKQHSRLKYFALYNNYCAKERCMVIPEFKHGVHEVSDGLVIKVGVPADVGRHVAKHGLHFPPSYCGPDLPPGVGRGEVPARQNYRPLDRLHVQEVT